MSVYTRWYTRRQVQHIANSLSDGRRIIYAHLYDRDSKGICSGAYGANLIPRLARETGMTEDAVARWMTED